MNSLMEIHLNKIRLFGFHGLDKGEDIVGGEFEVSVTAAFIPSSLSINSIDQTLDYTTILLIVKERMKTPAELLETLATEIAGEIIAKFSIVEEVTVSIYKLHPPIKSFIGSVGVTYRIKKN